MDSIGLRAFDRRRGGFVMGEGAGCLVLEAREVALARGARIYAEVLGYALNNDAFHMTSPRPDRSTIESCMRAALDAGRTAPAEIDWVSAHASATQLNDATETAAIRSVLGPRAFEIPVTGLKANFGHSLGAVSALELIVCCLAIHRGWIPPTLGERESDPACDLDYGSLEGWSLFPKRVLKNAFGFGGINAAIVLGNHSE